jgi:hypothetical protein
MIQSITKALANPFIINGIFTLLGSITGFLCGLLIAAKNARDESKRQMRELGFRMALANFEFTQKEAQKVANTGIPAQMYTLPVFVAEGIKLAEIISNPKLSAEEIGRKILEISSFTRTVGEHGDKNHQCKTG